MNRGVNLIKSRREALLGLKKEPGRVFYLDIRKKGED